MAQRSALHHGIAERADFFDLHFHDIAGVQEYRRLPQGLQLLLRYDLHAPARSQAYGEDQSGPR